MIDDPIRFEEALQKSESGERHLLLGNGFSCPDFRTKNEFFHLRCSNTPIFWGFCG